MTARGGRGGRSLIRKRGSRAERVRLLIVTEGIRTEPQYFDGLSAHLRATGTQVVTVRTVGTGRDPVKVVREADRRRAEEKRKGDPFDGVWCVVDVDDHHTLDQALTLAGSLGLNVAVSCPCFEVWLLWHFEDLLAPCTHAVLRKKPAGHGVTGKSLPLGFPYRNHADALRRAEAADARGGERANPSSSVRLLVRALADGRS
jgi:hypothetical protein